MPVSKPSSDLKRREKEIRDRVLGLYAQGVTRRETAEKLGLTDKVVRNIVFNARMKSDPRAEYRPGRAKAGSIYGVPRDLVDAFKSAASARGLNANQLRRRVLYVVTRDNLFDAFDINDPALMSRDVRGNRK
jgi:hypothetical protein